MNETKRLFDVVGPVHTKDILMTGRIMNSEEAFEIGVVDKLLPSEDLEEETLNFAKNSGNSQISVRATKRIVNELLNRVTEDTDEIKKMVIESYNSEAYREGIKAFMEKRKPEYKYS